jgi:hypothetical protein
MQKRKGLLFLLFFSALVSLFSFSSAQIYNSTNQNITTCGNITESGFFQFNQSLNGSLSDLEIDLENNNSCINVQASNVLIDCAGNSIINKTINFRAFYAYNKTNLTIINCAIGLNETNRNYGIFFVGVNESNVQKVNISSLYGVYLLNSTNNSFSFLNLSAANINLDFSNNNTFNNLVIEGTNPLIVSSFSRSNYLYSTNLTKISGGIEILINNSLFSIINVTNNQSKEVVDSNSSLLRGWFISFNITNSSGVGIRPWYRFLNISSDLVSRGVGNSNGGGYGDAYEYLFNGTDRIYYSNSTLNFYADGYAGNSSSLNITNNLQVNMTLHDFISPVVTITSPSDDSSYTGDSKEITVRYLVVENVSGIKNCTIYFDSNKYLNSSTVSTSAQNTYIRTIDSGQYDLMVKCTDDMGNIGSSDTISITITADDDDDDDSSGGGSGGGSSSDDDDDEDFWTNIYSPTSGQLQNGSNWALKQGERVKVSVNKITHYVGIISVTSSQVKINVSSKPQQNTLRIGDIWNVDVDSNGNLDISVKLVGINGTKANITITTLNSTSQTYTLVSGLNNSVVSANLTEVDTEPSTFSRVWGWTKDSTRGVFSRIFGNIIFKGIVVILIGILVGAVSMFLYLRKKKNKRIRGY